MKDRNAFLNTPAGLILVAVILSLLAAIAGGIDSGAINIP